MLIILMNNMTLYADLADELLAHTQSEDEQPDVDVAKQQRLLEQENDGDDENMSDTGTLTPGRDKMEIDETGSGSQKTGSTSEDKGDSLLKSRSPPTVRVTATALEPAPLTAPPPLQITVTGTAGSSIKSSYASDSSSNTVASKPMGTGFNGHVRGHPKTENCHLQAQDDRMPSGNAALVD